jgi:peptide deformylase
MVCGDLEAPQCSLPPGLCPRRSGTRGVGSSLEHIGPADMIRHEEGSVSMPGVTEEIERHARVRISYQDLSGVEKVEEADGLLSVCLQHEVDQLDGIFWTYRLSRLKRDRVVKRFDKTQRTQASGD